MHFDIALRDLSSTDAPRLQELANNKKVWLQLRDRFPHPYSIEDAEWFINYAQTNDQEMIKAIISNNELCGVIGAISLDDVYAGVGEVGYWLGEPHWSQGIGTKALQLFIDLCQSGRLYSRLEAGVYSNNLASMKLLEKCGFHKEGIRTARITKNEKVLDEHCYGLILS